MRRLEAPAVKIARGRGNPVTARNVVPPRRRPQPAWLRWMIRFGIGFGACAVLGGTAIWGLQSGWLQSEWSIARAAALDATANAGLNLQTVEVRGRSETRQADIVSALGAPRGAPLLGLDIDAMRERLVALPWIVSAEVERRYPSRLLVIVKEAEPMALWQRNQKLYLVSRAGKVIETAEIRKYAKLLVIVGDNAPERADALFDLLGQQPRLQERVTAAVFVGKRRWNLRFDNGVDVKLPEENPAAAWERFASLQDQYGLLEKDVSIIDMRLPDQVIVRRAHPSEPADSNSRAGDKPKDKAT